MRLCGMLYFHYNVCRARSRIEFPLLWASNSSLKHPCNTRILARFAYYSHLTPQPLLGGALRGR